MRYVEMVVALQLVGKFVAAGLLIGVFIASVGAPIVLVSRLIGPCS